MQAALGSGSELGVVGDVPLKFQKRIKNKDERGKEKRILKLSLRFQHVIIVDTKKITKRGEGDEMLKGICS